MKQKNSSKTGWKGYYGNSSAANLSSFSAQAHNRYDEKETGGKKRKMDVFIFQGQFKGRNVGLLLYSLIAVHVGVRHNSL